MSTGKHIEFNAEELRQKINLETGQLSWPELSRHFAKGIVIVVDPSLDLIEVAVQMCDDNAAQIEKWSNDGLLHRAQDEDARRWNEQQSTFWSCVVAPWLLVQEVRH
jgi:hypothetical protein